MLYDAASRPRVYIGEACICCCREDACVVGENVIFFFFGLRMSAPIAVWIMDIAPWPPS